LAKEANQKSKEEVLKSEEILDFCLDLNTLASLHDKTKEEFKHACKEGVF